MLEGVVMRRIERQVVTIKADIHCLWSELSALQMQAAENKNVYFQQEITRVKKLIAAKQDLLKTLAFDWNIGSLT